MAMSAHRVKQAAVTAGRMLAWRVHAYGGVDELRLEPARKPALRAPSDVLVQVHSSSLNPLDTAMIEGYGRTALGAWRKLEGLPEDALPLTVGRDFTGEVVRAGPDAKYRPGDQVWGVVPPHRTGAHAEFVVVDHGLLGPLPSTMSDITSGGGGALYCGLTALSALRTGGVEAAGGAGARVLLLGLGGVGQAALQLLRHAGAQVTVGCSSECREVARALGASAVLDRNAEDYSRLLEDHGPYDVTFDCAGLGNTILPSLVSLSRRVVSLSSPVLRETDARGLCLGAAAAAAKLVEDNVTVLGRTGLAGAPRAPPVRWAFFTPSADGILLLGKLAEKKK
ncbi:hypothetical protein JYU34_021466, partial [Plutella xylostella]